MQPLASIQIALLPTGQIQTAVSVGDRNMFLMMMEAAKLDVLGKFAEAKNSPLVSVAPPAIDLSKLRRNGK